MDIIVNVSKEYFSIEYCLFKAFSYMVTII